jgi:hypothetical protein
LLFEHLKDEHHIPGVLDTIWSSLSVFYESCFLKSTRKNMSQAPSRQFDITLRKQAQ